MSLAKVSVIIPTKNRKDALLRSLRSVYKQTLSPYEVIVVDDGSSVDNTHIYKKQFPQIKIIKNSVSKGGAVARNQGAEKATGEYLAFLDSDDEWLPNHLSHRIDVVKSQNADGIFGTFILVKGNDQKPISFKLNKSRNKQNIGNFILSEDRFDARTSSFFFKRNAFLEIKFDENLKKHQDWDLAINFDKKYRFILDTSPTLKIYVDQKEARMSQKLQHNLSFYFIEKNSSFLTENNIFMFCLKQIMRSQLAEEPQSIINEYLQIAKPFLKKLSLRNRLLFFLINSHLLNVGQLYLVLNKFRR